MLFDALRHTISLLTLLGMWRLDFKEMEIAVCGQTWTTFPTDWPRGQILHIRIFNGFDRTLEKLGEVLQLMYHNIIAGNLREGGGKIFVIDSLSMNILLTNEATLPTFTCAVQAATTILIICPTRNVLTPGHYILLCVVGLYDPLRLSLKIFFL